MLRDRICVILNPAARAATPEDVRALFADSDARALIDVRITERRGDAVTLARRAADEGFGTVVAAGGDGTLNEVVNGLMSRAARAVPPPVVGLLPLGTGNDFARTIDLPRDLREAWTTIEQRRTRRVDVVALERDDSQRWFINMSVGGAIDQIHDQLTDELKQRWGPLAYLRAGAEALTQLLSEIGPHQVSIRLDGGEPIELEVWSVAVANGRTVGGGIPVAPQADVSDGLLDCIAVPGVRGVAMVKLGAAVILGRHLDQAQELDAALDPQSQVESGEATVFFRRARTVEVRAMPPMPFTTDGEVNPGAESFFSVHAGALEMIVGAQG